MVKDEEEKKLGPEGRSTESARLEHAGTAAVTPQPETTTKAERPRSRLTEPSLTRMVAIVAAFGSLIGGFATLLAYLETREYVRLTRQLVAQSTEPVLTMDRAGISRNEP